MCSCIYTPSGVESGSETSGTSGGLCAAGRKRMVIDNHVLLQNTGGGGAYKHTVFNNHFSDQLMELMAPGSQLYDKGVSSEM